MMKQLGMVLMMAAACKGGDTEGKTGRSKDGAKAGCVITAKTPAELVPGKTAGLIAPFTGLSFGMTPADAARACPNFFQKDNAGKTGSFYVGEIVGQFGETYAQGRLEFAADQLVAVELALPPDIEAALTSAWGAPKISSGDKPAHAWFDEATGTRAVLGPAEYDGRRELTVSRYVPLAAFVEADTKTIAFKPQDILGKQPADLAKTFAPYLVVDKPRAGKTGNAEIDKMTTDAHKEVDKALGDLEKQAAAMGVDVKKHANLPKFALPASPFAAGLHTDTILHTDDDGSVRSYGVWFRTTNLSPAYGWPSQSADLIKKLDEVWGPHKMIKETLGDQHTWFDPKLGVRVHARVEKPEELDLVYSRYLPLATGFFGAPGPLWGFEKAERPLLGATPDEIEATYGTAGALKRDDKSGTITLLLPSTDYDGDTARTSILMFVRNGKVGEWRTHIPFDQYEPARAEYEAALEAKLGKPKARKETRVYGKKPTVEVEYSKYTHELDITVK